MSVQLSEAGGGSANPLMLADFEDERVLSLMTTTPGVSVCLTEKDAVSGNRALEVRVQPFSIHRNRWPYIALGAVYFTSPVDCSRYSKISATIRNVTEGLATVRVNFSSLPYNDGGRNLEGEGFVIPGGDSKVCEIPTSVFKSKVNDPSSLRIMLIVFPATETDAVYRIDAVQAIYDPVEGAPTEELRARADALANELETLDAKVNWEAVPQEDRGRMRSEIAALAEGLSQIQKACDTACAQGFRGNYRSLKDKVDKIARTIRRFVLADKKGLYLWKTNRYTYVYRNELPDFTSPTVDRIDVQIAIGEHRDAAFMVSACDRDIKLDVALKPGDGLPPKAIQIRECLFYAYDGEEVGDVLYRLEGPLTIPEGEARQVWLTVDTRNSGLKPGDYGFTLILRNSETGVEREIPGKVTVWDFNLPSWDSIPNNAYVEFDNCEVGAKVMEKAVEHMKVYGINMVYIYPHLMPWPVEVDDDLNIVNLDTTMLERFVKPVLKAWRAAPGDERVRFIFALTGAPERLLVRRDIAYPSERWRKVFAAWFALLKKTLRGWGLPDDDWILTLADESSEAALLNYELPLAEVIKAIDPTLKIVCNTSAVINDPAAAARFYKTFDFLRPNFDAIVKNPYLLEWVKKSGKPIWTYRCQGTLGRDKNLYDYFRVYGWKNYKYGIVAPGVWTYCAQGQSPWGKNQHGVAYCLVYKHRDKNDVVHSRRYEYYREGLDDYRYILALKKVAKERGPKEEEEAEKLIQKAIAEITSDVRDMTLCDVWRRRIAEQILALQKR